MFLQKMKQQSDVDDEDETSPLQASVEAKKPSQVRVSKEYKSVKNGVFHFSECLNVKLRHA